MPICLSNATISICNFSGDEVLRDTSLCSMRRPPGIAGRCHRALHRGTNAVTFEPGLRGCRHNPGSCAMRLAGGRLVPVPVQNSERQAAAPTGESSPTRLGSSTLRGTWIVPSKMRRAVRTRPAETTSMPSAAGWISRVTSICPAGCSTATTRGFDATSIRATSEATVPGATAALATQIAPVAACAWYARVGTR